MPYLKETPYRFIYWELQMTVQINEVYSHKFLNFTLVCYKA